MLYTEYSVHESENLLSSSLYRNLPAAGILLLSSPSVDAASHRRSVVWWSWDDDIHGYDNQGAVFISYPRYTLGPLLTYGLAWFGMFLLCSSKHKLFAYALIFASFAHLRFIQTLTGRGDELILAEQWFGITSRAIVAAIVFLIGLAAVIAAFRAIANRRRVLVFMCSWLLPLPSYL